MDDSRARFLSAISQRLGADRIVELHLFSPIRQGVLETGVAVIATAGEEAEPGEGEAEALGTGDEVASGQGEEAAAAPSSSHTLPLPLSDRLVVHTARYRLTRKGPDRGKWLFECAPTADAPLATVDAVARGVTLRSKDLTESERFTGEQLKQLLEDPAWRTRA